jgi:hypothetical protein
MRFDGAGPFLQNHVSSEFAELGLSLPLRIGY